MKIIFLLTLVFISACENKNKRLYKEIQILENRIGILRKEQDSLAKDNIKYKKPPAELKAIFNQYGLQIDNLTRRKDSLFGLMDK